MLSMMKKISKIYRLSSSTLFVDWKVITKIKTTNLPRLAIFFFTYTVTESLLFLFFFQFGKFDYFAGRGQANQFYCS